MRWYHEYKIKVHEIELDIRPPNGIMVGLRLETCRLVITVCDNYLMCFSLTRDSNTNTSLEIQGKDISCTDYSGMLKFVEALKVEDKAARDLHGSTTIAEVCSNYFQVPGFQDEFSSEDSW